MKCRVFATVAVTAALWMVGGHPAALLRAQSPASSAIPKLTGYWNGGLIGQPRAGGGGGRGGREAERPKGAKEPW